MYIDSKQGHLTQETLQSAIQTVAYQLVTTTATLVVWELLSLNPAAWQLSNPSQEVCLDRYNSGAKHFNMLCWDGRTKFCRYSKQLRNGEPFKMYLIVTKSIFSRYIKRDVF